MSQKLFSELGLSPEILKAVERMGFEQASPIQAEAIPTLLQGRDMLGQSQTGSGKTAAFGIPAVECVDASQSHVQVLILCPTRELASQVAEEIAKLAAFKKGVRELPIYGGASYDRQFRGLRAGPQIVIGTPGRLVDHIGNGALRVDQVKMVILDEADRMLDMGFRDDIEAILKTMPEERQTVFFSATMPPPIKKMMDSYTRDAAQVRIEASAQNTPDIDQSYVEVDYRSKTEVLCRLLDLHNVRSSIVFGFTKLQVDEVTDALLARGYSADKLHGDMAQNMRERVMKRFREKQIEVLVATDVAARGLDVDDLEMVINYELPHDPEDYVHRIGRTGRAGKSGKAISLVSGREYGRLMQVNRFTKSQIPRITVPRMEDLEQKHASRLVETLRNTLEAREYKMQDAIVDDLFQNGGFAPAEVISALLHLLGSELSRPVERIKEDDPRATMRQRNERPERPVRSERPQREAGAEDDGFANNDGGTEIRERPARTPRPARPVREISGDLPARIDDETGTWLKLNLGRNAGVLPKDIVGCIAGESGLPREVIGMISILPTITLVQVAREYSDDIVSAINGARLCGKKVAASPGQAPEPRAATGPSKRFSSRDDEGGPPRGGGGGNSYGSPSRGGYGGGGGGGGYGGKPGGGYKPRGPRPDRY